MNLKQLVPILLIVTFNVNADGNKFLSSCKTAIDAIDGRANAGSVLDAGRCIGFLQGTANLNKFYTVSLKDKSKVFFCIPKNVNSGELARVVVKHLKNNPDQLHEHEGGLVLEALKLAYPCK